jgi:hypothetical protein
MQAGSGARGRARNGRGHPAGHPIADEPLGCRVPVSCLLDGCDPVRTATLRALQTWPRDRPYIEVRQYIVPQLEPDELPLLQLDAPS